MLIYNFQKEFLGIDEKDLNTLGFRDLAGLRTEVTDFADLFVKTPGYIHNFKHVHWIDFITCAESNEESKVIINVNNKNYRCVVQITSAFLVDNPSSKAYLVSLNNLRELTHKESESISGDIIERQAPQIAPDAKPIFNTPELNGEFEHHEHEIEVPVEPTTLTVDPYETPLEIDMEATTETLSVDAYDDVQQADDLSLDVDMDDHFEEAPIEEDFTAPLAIEIEESLEIEDISLEEPIAAAHTTELVTENFDNGYTYDPTVASDELGLPLDLIEEFIEDFIEQAKEFKDDLYKSLDENDLDNLKILSHKLKGVAANLRIEDALEALTVVNTTSDTNVIKENLDTLYKIISKLAGEEISVEREVEITPPVEVETPQPEEDMLTLDFKEEEPEEDDLYSDPIEVEDSQVPEKIELAELADDTFMQDEEIKIDFEEEEEELKIDLDLDDEITLDEEVSLEIEDSLEVDAPLEIDEEFILEVDEAPSPIVIDYSKESVAGEIGLDIESFNELFHDYVQEAKNSTKVISEAISNGDMVTSQNEAVKLKGMSDNMRINAFSDELETLINSSNETEMAQAVTKIAAAITQLSTTGD